jgi:nitroimidazol reductase NimA-like FMN-containing flavoprotein (pyridoxamine 5'-phosphate oxidase superfamily)
MLEMMPHEIDEMLNESRIGRLCMADDRGRPYAIPLPFCWIDDSVYLRLPLTGRKGRILTSNSHVCFEVDQYSDDLQEYASVLVEGRLVPLSSLDEKLRVKQTNDEKYHRLRGGYRPGHGRSMPLDALPMQKIIVQSLSGRKKDSSRASQLVATTHGSRIEAS